MDILEKLSNIVGEEFTSNRPEELYIYSQDMTENPPSMPDYVVLPENVEQVQQIMRLANELRIPVTAFVAGSNVGGLTIPYDHGIIIDFKRMKKVVEINREDMYIVVEPGFTFGHLRKLLDEELPEFEYSFPFAPPYSSVTANAILQGLGNLSHKYGSMSESINGLEVVLPSGELVRVGFCAISPYWLSRTPLPDLVGLFVGFQGTTGLVTKCGISLWPKPPFQTHCMIFSTDPAEIYTSLIFKLCRSQICQEIGGGLLNTAIAKGILPMEKLEELISMMGLSPKYEGLYFANLCTLWGCSEEDLKAKYKFLVKLVNDTNKKENANMVLLRPEDYGEMGREMMTPINLPVQIPGLLNEGGLTWVGSYVPLSRWLEGCLRGVEIHKKYDRIPGVLHRPMKYGHYGVQRFLIPFNKSSEQDVQDVSAMCKELVEMILDIGGIPYKMPSWVAKIMMERADPNFVKLLKKIKQTLDPNGILNPGKLGI
ncbi:MAG TPA: FAD-binding oxidoreductase [Candidatus Deferrimicrobium sp.]|nr:FAD-binding oxidoreductase [Candidatus Deferrimicrobium sp.]